MLTTQFANYLSTSTDIQQWAKPIGYLWTQEDRVFSSLASKTKSFWKSFIQRYLQSHCCRWVSSTIYFGQFRFYFFYIQVKFPIIIWPQLLFPAPLVHPTSNTLYSNPPPDFHQITNHFVKIPVAANLQNDPDLLVFTLCALLCVVPSHVTRSACVANRIRQKWWYVPSKLVVLSVIYSVYFWVVFHCIVILQFVYAFTCWWILESFPILTTVNKTAVNMYV